MDKVLERLEAIEANQVRIMELLGAKSSRADYQKRYYAKRKAAKAVEAVKGRGKFRNPDRNNLTLRFGKDRRLFAKFMEWGRVGLKFGALNQPSRFLEWLCWAWQEVYTYRPITRSGGYNQLFIGWSNGKPLRTKVTDGDMFANVRRLTFTKVHQEQFAEALWWRWGYGVLYQVLNAMEEMDGYEALPERFLRPLRLMCGGFGQVEVKQGLIFDQNLKSLDELSKAYRLAKPDLDRGWGACMRGLAAKEQPYADFVNRASPSQSPRPSTTPRTLP